MDFSSESHHARSLEALGHEVICLQEGQAIGIEVYEAARESDLFVWVHTHGWQTPGLPMHDVLQLLKDDGVPAITYHLDLWFGLERQKDIGTTPYWSLDHFFTVDRQMAEWLNADTSVKGHYLPPGVYHEEAVMLPRRKRFLHDVLFTGSKGYHPEWPFRPHLIEHLQRVYGRRFGHYGGGGKDTVRGMALNRLYADSKVVVGDSLNLNFSYPYYTSDRLTETTGRGGFIIYPYIEGIEEMFDLGTELVTYKHGDLDDLTEKINYYLQREEERERIRAAGHERAKKDHTYLVRWRHILKTVFG